MRIRFTGKQIVQAVGCGAFCLFICVMAFWNRTLFMEPLSAFLKGEYNVQEMKATVQGNYLDERLRGKNDLITLNGGYARLQGRTHYNHVQLMKNGMLTSLTTSMMSTSSFTDNLSVFSRFLEKQGIPFLFIMAPFKLPTEENLLPVGVTDMANAIADQALAEMKERNIPFVDLRTTMSRTREQIEKYFYRTDHHWNVEGCFDAYQYIMQAIQNQFPDTKMNYTDKALWEKTVVPDFWLGSDGRRVGPLYAGADALDYYLPSFPTEMARYSLGVWTCKGDFREANMREWLLERSDYYDMDTYSRYLGGGYAITLHRNAQAENPMKLLMIRDSFMLPVECFLSTELASIDVLDPRLFGAMTETDYITLNQPDMVIMMIYPEIFPSIYFPYYFAAEGGTLEVLSEMQPEDLPVAGTAGNEDYQVLPVRLEGGRSYILTLDGIEVRNGEPDGANIRLYNGDTELDQTIFDMDYGKVYGYHWGFQTPEDIENEGELQLRFYAGVSGATEGMNLVYRGIRLQEGVLRKP